MRTHVAVVYYLDGHSTQHINNDNNQPVYAGQLSTFTHRTAQMVLHDRGIYHCL